MQHNMRNGAAALGMAALLLGIGVAVCDAHAQAPQTSGGYVLRGNTQGKVSYVVSQFERAYMNKNKEGMFKLMVPTTDAGILKRRSQWQRGYGPDQKPENKHSPILFDSQEGSFVPKSYTLFRVEEQDKDHWKAIVYEMGPYKNEHGTFKVKRTRYLTLVLFKDNKWYIQDYVAKEGQNDYAFAMDESVDTLTKPEK